MNARRPWRESQKVIVLWFLPEPEVARAPDDGGCLGAATPAADDAPPSTGALEPAQPHVLPAGPAHQLDFRRRGARDGELDDVIDHPGGGGLERRGKSHESNEPQEAHRCINRLVLRLVVGHGSGAMPPLHSPRGRRSRERTCPGLASWRAGSSLRTQLRLYIVITHAPPRPRLCCSATRAPSTWRSPAVPRKCHTSSVHWARPVAPSG